MSWKGRPGGRWAWAALIIAALSVGWQQGVMTQGRAPTYRVQPFWPQPFPDQSWVFGSITGVTVDSQNHIWVVHRGNDSLEGNEKGMVQNPPTSSVCCQAAPFVLEFDQAGKLLSSWGGPGQGYKWPQSPGSLTVDSKGNVWITAAGLEPAPAGGAGRARDAVVGETEPQPGGRGAGPAGRGARGDAAAGGGGRGDAAGAPPGRGGRGGNAPAGGRGDAAGGRGDGAGGRGDGGPGGGRGGRNGTPPPAIPPDAHVLKFSRDGKFLMQIGKEGLIEGPTATESLNKPSAIAFDAAANEVFIADTGNRRIAVFDADSGKYKRHWFAYGSASVNAPPAAYNPGEPPARSFRDVTCVEISRDGNVYVCDRSSNRIQVFSKDGKFVREAIVAGNTKGATVQGQFGVVSSHGSVWDIAFSNDNQQRYLFVADGHNKKVRILQRDTLTEVGTIGSGGRYPGQFLAVASVAVDSQGNLYTGEHHHGKRVQKFTQGR